MGSDLEHMDYSELLKNAVKLDRQIKKGIVGEYHSMNNYKIAVLGSYSIQFFVMVLRYMLSEEGITADIYEGDYHGINLAVFDDYSEFYAFDPDAVILLPYHEDVSMTPELFEAKENIRQKVQDTLRLYENMWYRITDKLNCHILHANFVIPVLRSMGELEANYMFSYTHFLKSLNLELEVIHPPNVTIIDLDYLASNIGKYHWFDYSAYYLNKAGFCLEYIKFVVQAFVNPVKALLGRIRKCLVLDLDNTLWGGMVGESGYDGIMLDPNHAEGESYLAFQRYILGLKARGVILAVCSKNDDNIAREPFEKNENMLIHLEDISCFTANWEDKVSNIRYIAAKLNIGMDSIVFVDDNPAERDIVKKFLPEVKVIDLPEDAAEYSIALEKAEPFEWLQITKDDIDRSRYYFDNEKRDGFKLNFSDYEDYLMALKMEGNVYQLHEDNISRFVQLINKANQFNLRTKRYHEAEIRQMLAEERYCLLYVRIKDRFSDYGLISCIILKREGEACFVDTWLMSCRVLKRDIEKMVCERILQMAEKWQCRFVVGEYIPTPKNAMVKELYPSLGFVPLVDKNDYRTTEISTVYRMDIGCERRWNYPIKLLYRGE